jgi:DNA-binding PadR family transcriptional regulator
MSLKHSLLALLSLESKTGYDLSKDIEGSTGFFWAATHQQVYRDLAELEQKKWVKHKDIEQSDRPDKKLYSTTKEGIIELNRWIKEPTDPPSSKDALLIKLFVGDLIEPITLLDDLLRHKASHQYKQKKYAEIEKEHFQKINKPSLKQQFQYITLRRGIIFENAWLKWCSETEDFLRKQAKKQRK